MGILVDKSLNYEDVYPSGSKIALFLSISTQINTFFCFIIIGTGFIYSVFLLFK